MWQSKMCPDLQLTESEPRGMVHTAFIENLGGVHMHGTHAGTDPHYSVGSNGCPGGRHMQCI